MKNKQFVPIETLDHHIASEELNHPGATGEFTFLLHDLMFAIRIISRDVRRAGLNDILGLTAGTNVHGEQVKKLDEYSNQVIIKTMERGGHLAVMASEENDELIRIPEKYKRGKYVLVFDPLDGSSNIDCNVTIGTLFGLYKRIDINSDAEGTMDDVLQPGSQLVAAGYALYGSSTVLVYTTGNGVHFFTYDPTIGEFLKTRENIVIPKRGKYYSINDGNKNRWKPEMQKYIEYLKEESEDGTRPYSSRYIGSGVADFHRTLIYGGTYIYPDDKNYPEGKLRLVYECNPLAMLCEQAGGRATDGKRRILDIKPDSIHQRCPLYVGSEEDILECEAFLRGERK